MTQWTPCTWAIIISIPFFFGLLIGWMWGKD
jgi:hypothetical protein